MPGLMQSFKVQIKVGLTVSNAGDLSLGHSAEGVLEVSSG